MADIQQQLQDVFTTFAKGTDMDGKSFAKLCKDCKVVNKKCTATDVDLNFAKAKTKGTRKINFEQFRVALSHCAQKRGDKAADLEAKVVSAGGPVFTGTKAAAVALHDDKSNYTGVHAAGGPSTVDNHQGLSALLDRSSADARGVKKETESAAAGVANMNLGSATVKQKKACETKQDEPVAAASVGSLEKLFKQFAKGAEMDGKSFAKLCKDCKVVNKKCTATDVDLNFAKAKTKGTRKINFEQFRVALSHCAQKRGDKAADLEAKVVSAGGPVFKGTKAASVALHDDKSNYTGVHAAGGPSTVDKANHQGLSGLLDRSDADARGVKK